MQKIVPSLWFDHNAEEAIDFYLTVFPDAKILNKYYYPKEGLADFQKEFAGKVLTIEFELFGQKFTAINAGSEFKFNEAISLIIECKDQAEIDYYWGKLSAVPEAEQCGWLKDKYGLSWQVVPEGIDAKINQPGVWDKMMAMKKIVIADL